jgi:hypothetical protein
MLWKKIKVGACVFAFAALIAGGLTFGVLAGEGQPPTSAEKKRGEPVVGGQPPEKKAAPDTQDAAVKKARMARYEALAKAAQDQFEARWKEFLAGKITTDLMLPWSVTWLNAQLRLCEKAPERVAAYKAHLERMKDAEKISQTRFDTGHIAKTDLYPNVYYRIEAEIWLDDARAMK